MNDYSVEDALVDLDALENDALAGDEFSAAIQRVREFVRALAAEAKRVETAGFILDDGQ